MWWALLVLGCSAPSDTFIERPKAARAVVSPDASRVLRFGGSQVELLALPSGEISGTWDVGLTEALLPSDGGPPLALDARQGLFLLGANGEPQEVWGRSGGYPSGADWGTLSWVGADEQEVVISGSRWLTHRYHLDSGTIIEDAVPAQGHPAVILAETGEVVSRHRRQRDLLFGWSPVEKRDLWVLTHELDADGAFNARYPSESGPYHPDVQLRLSPDGTTVATAGYSEVVNIVAPLDAFVTAYLTPPWVEVVTSLDWSPSGEEVLVGYGDGRAAVFDAEDGEVLWTGNSRDALYEHGELQEWLAQRANRLRHLHPLPVEGMGLQADGTVVVAHRLGVHLYPKAVVRR